MTGRRLIILGFGSVAQTTFPLVKDLLPWTSIHIYERNKLTDDDLLPTKGYDVHVHQYEITTEEQAKQVAAITQDNDIVLDFMAGLASLQTMLALEAHKGVTYLASSLEDSYELEDCAQSTTYTAVLSRRNEIHNTCCVDAGANPGLITHFAILGLLSMARAAVANGVIDAEKIAELVARRDLPRLATQLRVEMIHVAELEEMKPPDPDAWRGVAVSSWCLEAFHSEWIQRSEIARGSDSADFFASAPGYDLMEDVDPVHLRIPPRTHMRSATPYKQYVGRVVAHPETMEIGRVLHDKEKGHVPTVAFVYCPSAISRSPFEIDPEGWKSWPTKTMTERNMGPVDGYESMGALLISARDDVNPRYFGSILTCDETRRLKCSTNPTVMQVAASALAHLTASLEGGMKGVCMPSDFNSERIIEIAGPLLGEVADRDCQRLPARWPELLEGPLVG